ncbi:MAG TPA: lytic murein transglycosylase B [Burkholderiales bacterium]|nr:lytic murein transglycosylase B [Burkholderiales bacterium]
MTRPEVQAFIVEMAERHGFEPGMLQDTLAGARFQASIIRAVTTPGTARPWHEFRANFVNAQRIGGGLGFWDENESSLARAEAEYGVPAEIIVAVIGVETLYGSRMGSHRVLDALYTLAFDYPQRADFFRGELEQFLLFVRDNGGDPGRPRGSYAGAMGIPQFMPSSVRSYAVDFDGDGRLDLWQGATDSIGSVAHYLHVFGWQPGEPVMARAEVSGGDVEALVAEGIKPQRTVEELAVAGVVPLEPLPGDRKAALIRLEGAEGAEYWLVLDNFYVITRYNRSQNYATAVYQLAGEIRALRK